MGYDIDEWSVENAKHNALLNGVDNMEVLFGNSSVLNHISGVFDVVMANINRNILLDDMRLFRSVMNTDATLILSGFYEEDVPVLLEKANELGLHETARHTDNNWELGVALRNNSVRSQLLTPNSQLLTPNYHSSSSNFFSLLLLPMQSCFRS